MFDKEIGSSSINFCCNQGDSRLKLKFAVDGGFEGFEEVICLNL